VDEFLGLDIGGGSTEFILDRPGQTPVVQSVNLGVVRVREQFLRHDPPTAEEIRRTRSAVSQAVLETLSSLGKVSLSTLVGTAGTITTLAAMAQGMAQYTPARIHNYVLNLDRIRSLERTLLHSGSAERRRLVGLEPGREDVIGAGSLILTSVMETLGISECLVSDRGLREGIVLNLAARLKGDASCVKRHA
jgi:exopolyphosphatase / guanosine-5'-triphosphate,3'-diphosphate pyrophosphatase